MATKRQMVKNLSALCPGQSVRVWHYDRLPSGRVEVSKGSVVTVRAVERLGDRVTVLDALGPVASSHDGSKRLEWV